MASVSIQGDPVLSQGYLKVNGTTAATITTTGINADVVGNVTGNVVGNAATATTATTATKLSTASGSAPSYACRAWVNFDGTRDSTGAASTANTNRFIRASGNVASVLRNGTGDYTVNFATAMADANYSVCVGAGQGTSGTVASTITTAGAAPTTSTFRIGFGNNAFTYTDPALVFAQVFGN